jgi:hypothetical protein
MIEEAEYTVRITLTTSVTFSPIERDGKITRQDAIDNAFGQLPDSVWAAMEDEGWGIEASAEREEA